jgi:Tol biopolymer transport system component
MYNDLEAQFSPDGQKIFFSSNRKADATDTITDYDIWYVTKEANGSWGKPVHSGYTVNSLHDEFYPSVTKSGNLYFTAQLENAVGKEDIFLCEWKNGQYLPPVPVSTAINTKGYEFNAFIDPDEQFILFTGYGRKDDMGRGDLYISKKNEQGEWQEAKNMGTLINSKGLDYCPFVSWDKRILFFSSNRHLHKAPFEKPVNALMLKNFLSTPGNGLDDIYWVRFDELLKQY